MLNIAVRTGDNPYKSNYSSLYPRFSLAHYVQWELWDDQVEVHHVIISGIL